MQKLFLLMLLQVGQSSSTVDLVPGSAAERSARSAAALLTPGRWEGSSTVTDVEVPAMPRDAAAKMKALLARKQAFARCLTAKDVKKRAADFFAQGEDCRYERFGMANGQVDAKMQCKRAGAIVHSTTAGQFSRDRFNLTMTSMNPGMPDQPLSGYKMTLKLEARRVGKCRGDEAR